MSEDERQAMQLKQPWIKIGTDADGPDPDSTREFTHPRAYGTYPRILGKYVRDEHVLPLEDAIRKMSGAVANRLLIARSRAAARGDVRGRRRLRSGDDSGAHARTRSRNQLSTGVREVFVNGVEVIRDGKHTGAKPGRVVRGPGWHATEGKER